MYILLIDGSVESQIALFFCAMKDMNIKIIKKEEIKDSKLIKVNPQDIVYPTLIGKTPDDYVRSLYPIIMYVNVRVPCPDLIPRQLRGNLQNTHRIFNIAYELIHTNEYWKVFTDLDNVKILSISEPSLIDITLAPILDQQEFIPKGLEIYLNNIKNLKEYKFSKGELGNEFTQRIKL